EEGVGLLLGLDRVAGGPAFLQAVADEALGRLEHAARALATVRAGVGGRAVHGPVGLQRRAAAQEGRGQQRELPHMSQHSLACSSSAGSSWARRTKSCTWALAQALPTLGQAEARRSFLRSATAKGRALRSLTRPLGTTSIMAWGLSARVRISCCMP